MNHKEATDQSVAMAEALSAAFDQHWYPAPRDVTQLYEPVEEEWRPVARCGEWRVQPFGKGRYVATREFLGKTRSVRSTSPEKAVMELKNYMQQTVLRLIKQIREEVAGCELQLDATFRNELLKMLVKNDEKKK